MIVNLSRMSRWAGAGLAVSLIGVTGCFDRPVDDLPLGGMSEIRTEFPVAVNRKLDLLFVIDQSASMQNEQDALAANFQLLMDQIISAKYGTPNLHIGVISTNLGVGAYSGVSGLGSCGETGDGAILQNTPRPAAGETEPTCTGPSDRYIIDEAAEDGTRRTNYDQNQSLAQTFSCIARLGTQGCGFEQQLEAMRRALDDSVPENAGFLREDARLAIVFVSDEDDCSVRNQDMFNLNNVLIGRQSDFRCQTHGLTCENGAPTDRGEYVGCVPAEDSPYMHDVGEYVTFLRGIKKYPDRDILVAGIIGDVKDPIVIGDHVAVQGEIGVQQSCFLPNGDTDGAFPAIRLQAFFDAFPFKQTGSICSDLSGVLRDIGEFIGPPPEGACVPSSLLDQDDTAAGLQPECVVAEIRDPDTDVQTERLLPVCDNESDPASSATLPCYTLTERIDDCGVETPYFVDVHYAPSDVVPPGTELRVRCLAH
jgi:hypothetical protein